MEFGTPSFNFVTLKQSFAHDRNLRETEQFQHLVLAFLGWCGHQTQATCMIDQWFAKAAIDQLYSRSHWLHKPSHMIVFAQVLKNNYIVYNYIDILHE